RPPCLALRQESEWPGAGTRGGRRLRPARVGRDHGVPRGAVPGAGLVACRRGRARVRAALARSVRRPSRTRVLRASPRRAFTTRRTAPRPRRGARGAVVPQRARVRARRRRLRPVDPAGAREPGRRARTVPRALGLARAPDGAPSGRRRARADGRTRPMKVILLHAFPLDERMWEPQLETLRDYDVVTPRLSGRGASLDDWAASLLDENDGELALVGASLGGYVALAITNRAPERVRALALVGARADADSAERRASRADTISLIEAGGAEALWENQRPKLLLDAASEDAVNRARELVLSRRTDELTGAVR